MVAPLLPVSLEELQVALHEQTSRSAAGETILKRQEEAVRQEERNRRLEKLYTEAHRLHQDRNRQAVIDLFEQMNSEDPNFPDPEGLLVSSRDALGLEQRVATVYDLGQQHMNAGEWQQALECFGEVERLKSNRRETKALLEQARQQVTADTKSP